MCDTCQKCVQSTSTSASLNQCTIQPRNQPFSRRQMTRLQIRHNQAVRVCQGLTQPEKHIALTLSIQCYITFVQQVLLSFSACFRCPSLDFLSFHYRSATSNRPTSLDKADMSHHYQPSRAPPEVHPHSSFSGVVGSMRDLYRQLGSRSLNPKPILQTSTEILASNHCARGKSQVSTEQYVPF
jgi:hypothetical protein